MKRSLSLIAPLALVFLVACGGGSDPVAPAPGQATSIAYTDPTAATAHDWKLVKDTTSTNTKLVLKLVGPSDGTKYRGAGFTLKLDPTKVKAARFKDASGTPLGYYTDGRIFLDKNDAGKDMAPSLQAGGYAKGTLMEGIYPKTDEGAWGTEKGALAKDCSGTVLQVTLELDPALKAMPGDVPLSVTKAKIIPELLSSEWTRRKMVNVSIKVGTLTLK